MHLSWSVMALRKPVWEHRFWDALDIPIIQSNSLDTKDPAFEAHKNRAPFQWPGVAGENMILLGRPIAWA